MMSKVTEPLSSDEAARVVETLAAEPREGEWFEFKVNNADPNEIGEYISALSNSARLNTRPWGYVAWGVEDGSHQIVGTTFDPEAAKVGGEELINWLTHSLSPQIHFYFVRTEVESLPVVLLVIQAAHSKPVRFKGAEFVRVGSYKKRLREHVAHERRLWKLLEAEPFEKSIMRDRLRDEDILELIDFEAYFSLLDQPIPDDTSVVLDALRSDGMIHLAEGAGWGVTGVGGILFARDLRNFDAISRKSPRVIQYAGSDRVQTLREQEGVRGYSAGFQGLVQFVAGLLPASEVIDQALRRTAQVYPELAVRELIANALVHQDFAVQGTGPTIEIFTDRLEITNPGDPLIDTQRFIDNPPISRNEGLAAMMRRIGVCEERGSGWDKITFQAEYHQLPPPLIEAYNQHTRVVLFAPRPLNKMDKAERIRAIYQHACLRYVSREHMTNTTVRSRFGIEARNSAQASRLIKEALEAGAVVPYDAAAGTRSMRYLPFWARATQDDMS